MTVLNKTFYMVPDLKNHKNTTTCKTTIDTIQQSNLKFRSNIHCQWRSRSDSLGSFGGHLRSKWIFTLSYIFLLSSNFSIFPLEDPFRVFLQVCLQVFPSISNSFQLQFFLKNRFRCGNSVDFLYGGLIVRVSSCLSAFRSFALHTFFQITWLNLEQTMGPYIRAKYPYGLVWFIPIYSEHGKRKSNMGK